jgi:hypothetical protein
VSDLKQVETYDDDFILKNTFPNAQYAWEVYTSDSTKIDALSRYYSDDPIMKFSFISDGAYYLVAYVKLPEGTAVAINAGIIYVSNNVASIQPAVEIITDALPQEIINDNSETNSNAVFNSDNIITRVLESTIVLQNTFVAEMYSWELDIVDESGENILLYSVPENDGTDMFVYTFGD